MKMLLQKILGARGAALVAGLALLAALSVSAQAAPKAPAVEATPQDSVELQFMNRPIIRFRGSLLGASPAVRAERGQNNLLTILKRHDKLDVSVQASPVGNAILVGPELAFLVTEDDVDKLASETLESLSRQTVARLETALAESQESRNGRALLFALGIALFELAVFCALVYGLTRARVWVSSRLLRAVSERTEKSKLAETGMIRRDRVLNTVRWLLNAVYWFWVALLAYKLLTLIFARFPYTRAWGEQLDDFLMGIILEIGSGIVSTVPNLLFAGVLFLLARAVVGMLKPLFDRVESGQQGLGWLDADTVKPTRKIANILIWIFALVMAYPYLPGAQTEAFKGMSVLIGLMVSLGASSVVGQAASGLILMYSRTLRRGEYVRIGDQEGTVMELGMFTTRIRTGRGAEITLPNSMIVGSATHNYSRTVQGVGFVLDTVVTIGYDTPWRQVEAMLIEAAHRTPGVLSSPPARVFQTALSDFYPEYCLTCQAVPSQPRPRAEILSQLHANIQDVFNEYGVQIMSPHYFADPASDKLVPPAKWFTAPAQAPKAAE